MPLSQPRDFCEFVGRHRRQAAVLGLLLIAVPGSANAADQLLLLDVHVNGYGTGKIGAFTLRDGVLLSQSEELQDLGIKTPASAVAGPDGLVALRDLPGVAWRLEAATQTIYITAADNRLLPEQLGGGNSPQPGPAVQSGAGATFNYDMTETSTGNRHVASGLLDLRVFSPWGVASSDSLVYAGGGPAGPGSTSQIRLDSTYTFSDTETLRQYRVGDFINGALAWTRPVRLGGVQITSNFSLRPDLVTFPLPSVSASAAVPSTVDVLVNGSQLLSRQIQAGPFEIPQLPVVTGAGTVSMTVTDALGRQTTVSLPYYASAQMLAPDIQSFSGQVGAIRRKWGAVSDDYGDLAASGTYRRGISPWLTIEGSAEATVGTAMAGGGVVVNIDNLAVFNLSASGSTGSGAGTALAGFNRNSAAGARPGRNGTQLSVGLQRIGRVFSVGASAIVASRNYRDIAAMNGDPVPRLQLNASAGVSMGRFGSLGIGYTRSDSDSLPSPVEVYVPPGTVIGANVTSVGGTSYVQQAQKARVLTLSYSVEVGEMSAYATGYRDSAHGGGSGVVVGLTIPLGGRRSASVSVGSGAGGLYEQAQSQQAAVEVGDWGYQAVASSGAHTRHEFAEGEYMSPWGLFTAGADRLNNQTTIRAEAQGAVSFIDGAVFPSNAIPDAFAVVDTNGLANVRVLQENRELGVTDSDGKLIAPALRSFDLNHIAIDPTDIPLSASADTITRNVRPQDRSGIVVKFPIRVSHGALLRLVDMAGAPIPVGSTAALLPKGAAAPVGYDGEAYIEDLGPHNRVLVEEPRGRRCYVSFDYAPAIDQIPAIGPLQCRQNDP